MAIGDYRPSCPLSLADSVGIYIILGIIFVIASNHYDLPWDVWVSKHISKTTSIITIITLCIAAFLSVTKYIKSYLIKFVSFTFVIIIVSVWEPIHNQIPYVGFGALLITIVVILITNKTHKEF